MFSKEAELNLVADLNENALVELNAADVDDVSGALPFLIWAAGYYAVVYGPSIAAGAAALGAGIGAGYYINKK